jgi:hypothetical protein
VRTFLWGLFWVGIALWIAHHPTQASNFVHGIGTFLSSLVSH